MKKKILRVVSSNGQPTSSHSKRGITDKRSASTSQSTAQEVSKTAEFPTIIQSSWNQAITLQACSFLLPILWTWHGILFWWPIHQIWLGWVLSLERLLRHTHLTSHHQNPSITPATRDMTNLSSPEASQRTGVVVVRRIAQNMTVNIPVFEILFFSSKWSQHHLSPSIRQGWSFLQQFNMPHRCITTRWTTSDRFYFWKWTTNGRFGPPKYPPYPKSLKDSYHANHSSFSPNSFVPALLDT